MEVRQSEENQHAQIRTSSISAVPALEDPCESRSSSNLSASALHCAYLVHLFALLSCPCRSRAHRRPGAGGSRSPGTVARAFTCSTWVHLSGRHSSRDRSQHLVASLLDFRPLFCHAHMSPDLVRLLESFQLPCFYAEFARSGLFTTGSPRRSCNVPEVSLLPPFSSPMAPLFVVRFE